MSIVAAEARSQMKTGRMTEHGLSSDDQAFRPIGLILLLKASRRAERGIGNMYGHTVGLEY